LHPVAQPATPLSPDRHHSFPFVFLFPSAVSLPPSMIFPQGLGRVEYSIAVVLKGKKKFGSAKKWSTTLVLKVELARRAIGARLEQRSIADAIIPQTKHLIMVFVSPAHELTTARTPRNHSSRVHEPLLHTALSPRPPASKHLRSNVGSTVLLQSFGRQLPWYFDGRSCLSCWPSRIQYSGSRKR